MDSTLKQGQIVEHIDQQKLICSVIIEVKKQRLRLFTEGNREVNLSAGRLSLSSGEMLDSTLSRDKLLVALKATARRREALKKEIDVKELWELLHEEGETITLITMAEYCFSGPIAGDQLSAVTRAFFANRLYFKFKNDLFTPNSKKQIEQSVARAAEEERRNRVIEDGSKWLKKAVEADKPVKSEDSAEIIKILKSYYLYEKESRHAAMGKALLSRASLDLDDRIFRLLVKLGEWSPHENLDLIRQEIPTKFPNKLNGRGDGFKHLLAQLPGTPGRRDMSNLAAMTIDGQATKDFDDALTIESDGDNYILGIHIIDVGHFIPKGSDLDEEAKTRASSIYMPDDKIPMLPPDLSEDVCSLKAGELKPTISIMVNINKYYSVTGHEIVPGIIRVQDRLTYSDVNKIADSDPRISALYKIGLAFREKRLSGGAIQINLPEINVWIDEAGEIVINRVDRESPGRMFVAETMIMANGLMADFLTDNGLPAVFRAQPEPKQRLFKGVSDSLFLNCMQRKHLSRAFISSKAEFHSGLGLKAYSTVTSPIRRYFDLVSQRQIRSVFGLETPYTEEEIKEIIFMQEQPMSAIGRIQFMRRRYWILKHLEKLKGSSVEAIVLDKKRDFYIVLITEYMLEVKLSTSWDKHKPKDLLSLIIQHADARKDLLSIYAG